MPQNRRKSQKQLIDEIHAKIEETHASVEETRGRMQWLMTDIRVNGTDGTEPVFGIQNILEYQNKRQKELMDVTSELRAKRDFRKALDRLLETSPTLRIVVKVGTSKWFYLTLLPIVASYLGLDWILKLIK